ncbi:anti-sigma factor domain-containing protein [Streptomyces sp. NPDC090022]|uniref:anti-sigma factor n=1 Tax=Streptomyces sp. NPDC090022 TaxID=3365920 RepID=UPI0037FC656F
MTPAPAPDPHAALAAYVLHALPPDEEAAFARHLAHCHRCRREAVSLAAAAGALAELPPVAPPAALRDRVLERIATSPQGPAADDDGPPPHVPAARTARTARTVRALRWALAACLALVVATGGIAYWQHEQAEEARAGLAVALMDPMAQLAQVLAAPDARMSATVFTDGATGCVIFSRSSHRAAFIASGLPKLSAGQVYALWYDDAGARRPAGTFPGALEKWHIALLDGPVDHATAVGVTVEPVGAVTGPTTDPIGVIDIPA